MGVERHFVNLFLYQIVDLRELEKNIQGRHVVYENTFLFEGIFCPTCDRRHGPCNFVGLFVSLHKVADLFFKEQEFNFFGRSLKEQRNKELQKEGKKKQNEVR